MVPSISAAKKLDPPRRCDMAFGSKASMYSAEGQTSCCVHSSDGGGAQLQRGRLAPHWHRDDEDAYKAIVTRDADGALVPWKKLDAPRRCDVVSGSTVCMYSVERAHVMMRAQFRRRLRASSTWPAESPLTQRQRGRGQCHCYTSRRWCPCSLRGNWIDLAVAMWREDSERGQG